MDLRNASACLDCCRRYDHHKRLFLYSHFCYIVLFVFALKFLIGFISLDVILFAIVTSYKNKVQIFKSVSDRPGKDITQR